VEIPDFTVTRHNVSMNKTRKTVKNFDFYGEKETYNFISFKLSFISRSSYLLIINGI